MTKMIMQNRWVKRVCLVCIYRFASVYVYYLEYLRIFWNILQASKIVSTATRPAGQVTGKSTCPAGKPTCPAFLYDNVFSQLTNKGEMRFLSASCI